MKIKCSTVTDSLCNSGAFSNPNAVRDCPFNLKGAWFFIPESEVFFVYSAIVFKAFQRGPTLEVLRVGVMIVGVIIVGVLSVGVMTLSPQMNRNTVNK
jgi:hypothetical protein